MVVGETLIPVKIIFGAGGIIGVKVIFKLTQVSK